MSRIVLTPALLLLAASVSSAQPLPLRISANQRHLVTEDGEPIFWLGDTAWEVFTHLTPHEMITYLDRRHAQQFNVIQATILAGIDLKLNVPNPAGQLPLGKTKGRFDPGKPNEAYFATVDFFLDAAAKRGMYVALVATWGEHVNGWRDTPRLFTPAKALRYGQFLGNRYRGRDNIIWVLGGDQPPVAPGRDDRPIWRAMAEGLTETFAGGDPEQILLTYHPRGRRNPFAFWSGEPWLDFYMMQSGPGAGRDYVNAFVIAEGYSRTSPKPILDAEPSYENANPRIRYTAHDIRKQAWWAVLAGAFGHTYGALEVWQFCKSGYPCRNGGERSWTEAVQYPGAGDMRHIRALLRDTPVVPRQSLIASAIGQGTHHVRAALSADGLRAFVYIPTGQPVTIRTDWVATGRLTARWFDPRDGTFSEIGSFPGGSSHVFTPPKEGEDWVLSLEQTPQ